MSKKTDRKLLNEILSLFGTRKLLTNPQLPVDFVKDPVIGGKDWKSFGNEYCRYVLYTANLGDFLKDAFDFDYYTGQIKKFMESQNLSVDDDASLKKLQITIEIRVSKLSFSYDSFRFSYEIRISDWLHFDASLFKKKFTTNTFAPNDVLSGVNETKKLLGMTTSLSPERIAEELGETIDSLTSTVNKNIISYNLEAICRRLNSFFGVPF